jgi:hypothetical protein
MMMGPAPMMRMEEMSVRFGMVDPRVASRKAAGTRHLQNGWMCLEISC